MMKFTVITITYNEEKNIEKTMRSVLDQDYKDIEYLLLDGASADATVKIAQKLAETSGREVQIISESDFGIYNAMNRGIARASGDYVIFMNAGDSFWNPSVLSEMADKMQGNTQAIYYGKAYLTRNGRNREIRDVAKMGNSLYDVLIKGWMPVHQSIAAPLPVLRAHYFNEAFKIRADYDWLLRCYRDGVTFINLDMMVCRYDCDGFSSTTVKDNSFQNETGRIRKKNFPITGRIYEFMDKRQLSWR